MGPCLKTNKHLPPKLNINSSGNSQSHSFCDLIPSDGFTAVSGHPDDVLHSYQWARSVRVSSSLDKHKLRLRCSSSTCALNRLWYHQQQKNIKTTLLPLHLVSTTQFIFLGEVPQTDSNKSIKTETLKPPTTKCDTLEPARARHTFPWITLKDLCKNLLSSVQFITEILLYANSTFYITYDRNEIKYLSM